MEGTFITGRALPFAPELSAATCPAPLAAWQQLLRRDPEALISQSPAWIRCMRTFGFEDVSRLYELADGGHAVLPMVRRRGLMPAWAARRYSPPPAWGFGGVLSDRALSTAQLAAILDDLRSGPSLCTWIRPNPLAASLWAAACPRGTLVLPRLAHVIDLDGGAHEVWRRLSRSARWAISKARRSGLDVQCSSGTTLVPAFFQLLSCSVERWAAAQHEPLALARWRATRRDPLAKLEAMATALGEAMRVWVAFKDGEPAAGAVVLIGRNAHDTKAAINKELAAPLHASDLIRWLAIEAACDAGCRRYHLGESGRSRSLARFKEKFGARPVPYHEYRFERLPLTRVDSAARAAVKRVLRFKDTPEDGAAT